MLSAADLIYIPFSSELTKAGTDYLCQCLSRDQASIKLSDPKELHRFVCQTVAELAFRRHLDEHEILYELVTTSPFSKPEHLNAVLGGRRCEVFCFPLFQRANIRQLIQEPDRILSAPALVPVHEVDQAKYTSEDILIFAYLTGLIAVEKQDIQRALAAGLPVDLLSVLASTLE
jgi:hypothetical protein